MYPIYGQDENKFVQTKIKTGWASNGLLTDEMDC